MCVHKHKHTQERGWGVVYWKLVEADVGPLYLSFVFRWKLRKRLNFTRNSLLQVTHRGISENSLQSREKRENVKTPVICRHLGEGFGQMWNWGHRGRAGRAGRAGAVVAMHGGPLFTCRQQKQVRCFTCLFIYFKGVLVC